MPDPQISLLFNRLVLQASIDSGFYGASTPMVFVRMFRGVELKLLRLPAGIEE
jgi:hypothetical protein